MPGSAPGGVPEGGVPEGDVCQRGVPKRGRGSGPGGGIPACTEADPAVNRMTNSSNNITLATTSLRPVMPVMMLQDGNTKRPFISMYTCFAKKKFHFKFVNNGNDFMHQ